MNERAAPRPQAPVREDEISLSDIVLVLVRNRRLILLCMGVALTIGLVSALTTPSTYTVSTTMVPESADLRSGVGGLAALRGMGLNLPNLGSAGGGVRPEAYPRVLQSREVLLAALSDTVTPSGREMQLGTYLLRGPSTGEKVRRYTIGLPRVIMSKLAPVKPAASISETSTGGRRGLSRSEHAALGALGGRVSSSLDWEAGTFHLVVRDEDPTVAAQIAESVIGHFSNKVRAMQSEKQRQSLAFVTERREQARRELETAEAALASFVDRNAGIQSARLILERDRLLRLVSFHAEVHRDLQRQYTAAEIDLERSLPVISIVDPPVPPLWPSGPRRMGTVLLSLVLGGLLGVGAAFVRNAFRRESDDPQEHAKLQEIRQAFAFRRKSNGAKVVETSVH